MHPLTEIDVSVQEKENSRPVNYSQIQPYYARELLVNSQPYRTLSVVYDKIFEWIESNVSDVRFCGQIVSHLARTDEEPFTGGI